MNPSRRRRRGRRCGSVIYRSVWRQPPPLPASLKKFIWRLKRSALTPAADNSQTRQSPQPAAATADRPHLFHASHPSILLLHSISATIAFFHFRTARFPLRSPLIVATLSGFVKNVINSHTELSVFFSLEIDVWLVRRRRSALCGRRENDNNDILKNYFKLTKN